MARIEREGHRWEYKPVCWGAGFVWWDLGLCFDLIGDFWGGDAGLMRINSLFLSLSFDLFLSLSKDALDEEGEAGNRVQRSGCSSSCFDFAQHEEGGEVEGN